MVFSTSAGYTYVLALFADLCIMLFAWIEKPWTNYMWLQETDTMEKRKGRLVMRLILPSVPLPTPRDNFHCSSVSPIEVEMINEIKKTLTFFQTLMFFSDPNLGFNRWLHSDLRAQTSLLIYYERWGGQLKYYSREWFSYDPDTAYNERCLCRILRFHIHSIKPHSLKIIFNNILVTILPLENTNNNISDHRIRRQCS